MTGVGLVLRLPKQGYSAQYEMMVQCWGTPLRLCWKDSWSNKTRLGDDAQQLYACLIQTSPSS